MVNHEKINIASTWRTLGEKKSETTFINNIEVWFQ